MIEVHTVPPEILPEAEPVRGGAVPPAGIILPLPPTGPVRAAGAEAAETATTGERGRITRRSPLWA